MNFLKDTLWKKIGAVFLLIAFMIGIVNISAFAENEETPQELTVADTNPIRITPEKEPNENGFYQQDIVCHIHVSAFSELKIIKYQAVLHQGTYLEKITQEGILYQSENQPVKEWDGDITVLAEKNNADDVTVIIEAEDHSGAEYRQEKPFRINITRPEISVVFQDSPNKVKRGRGYYAQERMATVTVKDRPSCFDEEALIQGLCRLITATDAKNQDVLQDIDKRTMFGSWVHKGDEHTIPIYFNIDGNYEFALRNNENIYMNQAGLKNQIVNTYQSRTPYQFTVDRKNPSGTVSVAQNIWSQITKTLTFGLFKKGHSDVNVTFEDEVSPVSVQYYKTEDPSLLSVEELKELEQNGEFHSFQNSDLEKNGVNPDDRFVIYLKLSDYAGNEEYISTNGHIYDHTPCEITLTADKPNQNNSYHQDVKVKAVVTDGGTYSGISKVYYWVTCDGKKTEEQIFDFHADNPEFSDLINTWSRDFTVSAEKNNSSNVQVNFKAIDNAGNESTKSLNMDIDITAPAIKIEYTDTSNPEAKEGYLISRRAAVCITERTSHFSEKDAVAHIKITAKDAKGNSVNQAFRISEWETVEKSSPDEAQHTAVITFQKDANYTFSISYIDLAGNENTTPDVSGQKAPYSFTVDKTAPSGTVTAVSGEGKKETWNTKHHLLTYGFWSNQKISISGTSQDATSPVSCEYYLTAAQKANDITSVLENNALNQITSWKPFSSLVISENKEFVVYLKIMDSAGNYTYLNTDGLIVDHQKPAEETAPEITLTPQQPMNGIYHDDVSIAVTVDDPMVQGAYSGLKYISYQVFDRDSATPNVATQEGELYQFSKTEPKQGELLKTWHGNITVNSSLNNSNHIQVVIYAVDNAGNAVDNSQPSSNGYTSLKIDRTLPAAVISYDNNTAVSGVYFNADRVATIQVTERNFRPEDVKINITKDGQAISYPVVWTHKDGNFNQDNAVHETQIPYSADGEYTFDIDLQDAAGNRCVSKNYAAGTAAGQKFIIDKTRPVVKVSYDHHAAENHYYKTRRNVTVAIKEHNFSSKRVSVLNCSNINWKTNGDEYTAVITYTEDGKYTFDVECTDMAGNKAVYLEQDGKLLDDFPEEIFYIDNINPVIKITGVENESANNGDVIPVIEVEDENFDPDTLKISLDGANHGKEMRYNSYIRYTKNGKMIQLANFAKQLSMDDIYTLTVSCGDMAGRVSSQKIVFSVNRFGSTYDLSSIEHLMNQFVQKEEDIILREINVDELDMDSIQVKLFKNGDPRDLVLNSDYFITKVSGDDGSQWNQYQYVIKKELFQEDGNYRISVYSSDRAGNINENVDEEKAAEIVFGIDKTKPVIVLTNLRAEEQYNQNRFKAVAEIKDNLILKDVHILLNGKEIEYTQDGELYSFDIPESNQLQTVTVRAADAAGNEKEMEVSQILVSTNLFVRVYNNTVLFVILMIMMVLLIAGGITLVIFLRKRKHSRKD